MTASRNFFAVAAAASALLQANGAEAASVELLPPAHAVQVGDTFQVLMKGFDFTGLDGGGASVSFAPGVLEAVSVQIDSAWSFFSSGGTIDNGTGRISDMSFNVWGAMTGDFDIAVLSFKAIAAGTATIDLQESLMFPYAYGGQVIAVDMKGLQVQVSPVPEPGAWLLMLSGVALLAGRLTRRPQPVK